MDDNFGALAIAISTTIGAGVLGLPKALYTVGPVGILIGLVVGLFLVISAAMIADMLQRENKPVQIPMLIADVLGSRWKYLIYLTLIFSMYGALSAYLLGFGIQFNVLLGLQEIYGGLLLFLIGGVVIYNGTRLIERISMPLALVLVAFLVALAGLNLANFQGFHFMTPNLETSLKFTGTMLFALFGLNVMPEINFLTKSRPMKTYIFSTILCLTLYLGFAFSTVGVLGSKTTSLGTSGLALYYGGLFNVIISIFTIAALFSSFMGIGLSLMHIYNYDFKAPRLPATLAVIGPPLAIFFLSGPLNISFLDILGIAGELTLPVFAMTVAYAYTKVIPTIRARIPWPRKAAWVSMAFYAGMFLVSLVSLIV